MVDGDLVDLLTAKQHSIRALALVLQDLNVANAALFPLLGVRIEPRKKLVINLVSKNCQRLTLKSSGDKVFVNGAAGI